MANTIEYPVNPSIGDEFTVGGTRKRWDGTKWKNVSFGNHEVRIDKNYRATEALLKSLGLSGNFGFFDKGFTYTEEGDVGIDGNEQFWLYNGSLPFEVAKGTVPSEPDYEQRKFNEIANISGLRDELDDRVVNLTLAEVQAGNLKVDQYVRLVNYANALYQVVPAGDTGGLYKPLNDSVKLRLQYNKEINPLWLGQSQSDLLLALENADIVDGKGASYELSNLEYSRDNQTIRNLKITKASTAVSAIFNGRGIKLEDVEFESLSESDSGDVVVINGDNPVLINCSSYTAGIGKALVCTGSGAKVIGTRNGYISNGIHSIAMGDGVTLSLYSKIIGVDTSIGGGVEYNKHGSASITGCQVGTVTVGFGSGCYISNSRITGDLNIFGSFTAVGGSTISGDVTIGDRVNSISGVSFGEDVFIQSGSTFSLNEGVRESVIHYNQLDATVNVVTNLYGDANDVGNSIYSRPTDYTPSWSATTLQPAVGDGELSATYTRHGRLCKVDFELKIGSTTNTGEGNYSFSVPFASLNGAIGSARVFDAGTNFRLGVCELGNNDNQVQCYSEGEGTAVRHNSPMIWAQDDILRWSIDYITR